MRPSAASTTNKKKLNSHALRDLFSYLKPYPWRLVAALVAMTLAALAVLALGQGARLMVDGRFSRDTGALILLALSLFMAVASFFRFYLVAWLGERLVADIRQAFFSSVLGQDQQFFSNHRTGDLGARLITDTTVIQGVVSSAIPIAARNLILFTGGFAMLWITSASLAASILVTIPLVLLPLIGFGRFVRRYTKQVQAEVAEANTYAEETISSIKTVQAFSHEATDRQHYTSLTNGVFDLAIHRNFYRGLLTSSVITFVFCAIVWMVWRGGGEVASGNITPGELAAFVFYALITAGSVNALSELYSELQKAAGAAERIFSILRQPAGITAPATPTPLPTAPYVLAFENVSFAYPATPEMRVLENVSFSIQPGSFTAFAGASGAGKSSIMLLLLRFYDPIDGKITLNGIDIRDFDPTVYRCLFGTVSQEAPLFSMSLQDNIAYSPNTNSDIDAAIQVAAANEFINDLPNGLHTIPGERGTALSGGQRQRVAIARALHANRPVLLLDEATSALDQPTEATIMENLATREQTRVVITHRLSTVERADQVVLLENAKVVAIDTPDNLLTHSELYRRLSRQQELENVA